MRDATTVDDQQTFEAGALTAQADTPPADAPANAPATEAPANAPPQAADVCIVTAEDASLTFPVVVQDPDGDPLTFVVSQPQSGRAEVDPDGAVTFVAGEPGVASFQYSVEDPQGGADTANATVFVNPIADELAPPALSRIDPQDLPALAHACASAIALDAVTLRGAEVQIQDPTPGQRFQVFAEPGQQIQLQSRDFVDATYLVVDGGLLIVTPDGNMVYVADFVRTAQGDDPMTLSVYEGPEVAGDQLLASLQPLAGTEVSRLEPPEAGPAHGGGAAFSPYDPGTIGTGPDALGPLAPTALGLRTPPLLRDTGVTGDDEGTANQAPTLTASPGRIVPVGEITVTPEFASGRQFPQLAEQQALDSSLINGVDQGNFTLGPSADARITFVDEAAEFQNTLGVYLIDPDGTIHDPKIVFERIEHAEADPSQPVIRPGGGPLQPGDAVALSELYDSADLQEDGQFGLFFIRDGWTLNGDRLQGDLEFSSNGQPATVNDPTPQLVSTVGGDTFTIAGDIYHSADPMQGDGLANPLNEGGRTQTVSGLEPDVSGLTTSFEDVVLLSPSSDDDVNDTTIQVDLVPTTVLSFGFAPSVAPDLQIADPDGGNLSRATVEIVSGGSAVDALVLGAPLDGTGITAVEDGSTGLLVLEGDAPVETYEGVLRSVTLQAGDTLGVREIRVQVEDDQGAASAPVTVSLDFSSADLVIGSDGADTLQGGAGNDPLSGRAGDDQLSGLAGDDLMDGGSGNDILDGGPGSDLLFGGPGNDRVTGGDGADRFFIQTLPDRGDVLTDFNANEGDVLDLSSLFEGQATSANVADFLQFDPSGGNDVAVSADVDGGATGFDFVQVATLVDPTGVTTVQESVNNGAVAV